MPNGDIEEGERYWLWYATRTLDDARKYGLLSQFGISPDITARELSEQKVHALSQAVRQIKDREQAALLPAARQTWFEQWQVPKGERKEWAEYPLEYGAGHYLGAERGIMSPAVPSTIGHEAAHAAYSERMPKVMRDIAYPIAHQVAQRLSPPYREAAESYPAGRGRLPVEGYAQTYERLAKAPEKMPWYMEPFYGDLMYSVPDLPGEWERNWAAWLGSWVKSKVEKTSWADRLRGLLKKA